MNQQATRSGTTIYILQYDDEPASLLACSTPRLAYDTACGCLIDQGAPADGLYEGSTCAVLTADSKRASYESFERALYDGDQYQIVDLGGESITIQPVPVDALIYK